MNSILPWFCGLLLCVVGKWEKKIICCIPIKFSSGFPLSAFWEEKKFLENLSGLKFYRGNGVALLMMVLSENIPGIQGDFQTTLQHASFRIDILNFSKILPSAEHEVINLRSDNLILRRFHSHPSLSSCSRLQPDNIFCYLQKLHDEGKKDIF